MLDKVFFHAGSALAPMLTKAPEKCKPLFDALTAERPFARLPNRCTPPARQSDQYVRPTRAAGRTCATASGVGCYQLGSRSASGTYDPARHRFTITWFVGESFTPAGDSMTVHLTGIFIPSRS